jgi:GTPase
VCNASGWDIDAVLCSFSGSLSVGEDMLIGPDSAGQFCAVTIESIEVQRRAVPVLAAGETGALLLQFPPGFEVPATRIRRGTMLIHPSVCPRATRQFDAEVHFLTDASSIRENNYQAVIHAGQVRQMARLVRLLGTSNAVTTTTAAAAAATTSTAGAETTKCAAATGTTLCRFEFMYWAEYMRPDLPLVLREGNAQGVGRVVRTVDFGADQKTTSVRSC